MLARYVFGPGMDQPLVRYDGSGTGNKVSLHSDERGSITALSYGSPYAPTINRYDEYGRPGAGNVGRFQYTGQMWLSEAALYHYKARSYVPRLGIFAQADPIGYWDNANLYPYVRNDPVNLVDPLGLQGDDKDGRVKKDCGGSPIDIIVCGQKLPVPAAAAAAASLAVTGGVAAATVAGGAGGADGGPQPPPSPRERDYCTLAPDRLPSGENFGAACAKHDACYGTLGASKRACDLRLYEDMLIACNRPETLALCEYNAQQYLRAVSRFGWIPYLAAQLEARRED